MADRLTTEELDELERLHREAKRGAWYRTCTGELPLTHGAAMTFGDACLVTGAINALPRLIAAAREAERLRARVAEMERALREQHEDHAECCRQADALRVERDEARAGERKAIEWTRDLDGQIVSLRRELVEARAATAERELERSAARADRDALRGALREALLYVESAAAETLTYGAFPGGDPRQFTPEPSESTDEELEAHRTACARWDAAATPLDAESPAHQWEGDRHVAHAKYGHGTYLYRDPHASALLTVIRALLATTGDAMPSDTVTVRCACTYEAGDSPCPIHGMENAYWPLKPAGPAPSTPHRQDDPNDR